MTYAATSNTNSDRKTHFEGNMQFAVVNVTPDQASGDVTLTDYDKVIVIGKPLITGTQASTAFDVQAVEDSTTANKINCTMLNSDGGAATTFPAFRIPIMGKLFVP